MTLAGLGLRLAIGEYRGSGSRGDAAYYLACNRGKSSVCIDMARPEGQDLIRRLDGAIDTPDPAGVNPVAAQIGRLVAAFRQSGK